MHYICSIYMCMYIYTFSDWIIRTRIWSSVIVPSCTRGNWGIGGLSTCLGSLSSKGQKQDECPAVQVQHHPLHSYTTVSKCLLPFTSSKRKTIEERASGGPQGMNVWNYEAAPNATPALIFTCVVYLMVVTTLWGQCYGGSYLQILKLNPEELIIFSSQVASGRQSLAPGPGRHHHVLGFSRH